MIVSFWFRNYFFGSTNMIMWLNTVAYWAILIGASGSWVGYVLGAILILLNVYLPFRLMWDDIVMWKHMIRDTIVALNGTLDHDARNVYRQQCLETIEKLCPNLSGIKLMVVSSLIENAINLRRNQ